jgi:hypothetical protein
MNDIDRSKLKLTKYQIYFQSTNHGTLVKL